MDDFNKLFRNQHLTRDRYGKSINVRLESNGDGTITRHVKEDLTKVAVAGAANGLNDEDDGPLEMSCIYSQAGALSERGDEATEMNMPQNVEFCQSQMENPDLKTAIGCLKNFMAEFGVSKEYVCDVYVKVTGDHSRMRQVLEQDASIPISSRLWAAEENLTEDQKDKKVKNAKDKKGRRMPAFVWTALEDMALTEP